MKYEAKVKYTKLDEISGKEKTVSESYIVCNAETFADAEEQTFKHMAELTSASVVPAIKQSDVEDIIGKEGDWFYKAKIVTTIVDEINGKEQNVTTVLLINVDTFGAAFETCNQWMSESIFDCELTSMTKTKIVDIIG